MQLSRIPIVLTLLGLALATAVAAAAAEPIAAAHGDWPIWRGNPQHTGYQATPGNISSPSVAWRYHLGGRAVNSGLFLSREAAGDVLYVAPSGTLSSYFADGRPRWTRRYVSQAQIVGAFDLENDGRLALLVAQTPLSRSSLDVFDAATGDLIWSSPVHAGSIGSVKVADLDGDGVKEIVWAPAAASFLTAYRVRRNGDSRMVWTTTINDYISDPYTASSLAVADVTGDKLPDVVIAGGRGRVSMIVFSGRNGALEGRNDVRLPTGRTPESGGYAQSLALRDVDGDGIADMIVIGGYPQNASFMFQGVITATFKNLESPRVIDAYPYGMNYCDGSVSDFDHDGRAEVLVSHFDAARHAHVLMLLDAATLSVKAEIEGFLLSGIVDRDGPSPLILGFEGIDVEVPSGGRTVRAIRFQDGGFHVLSWRKANVGMPQSGQFLDPRAEIDNPGFRPVSVDVNGDGTGEVVLLERDIGMAGRRSLSAVEIASGNVIRSFNVLRFDAMTGTTQVGSGANTRFVTGFAGGDLFSADAHFDATRIEVGGYYRLEASDGHATEVPVVADLDGDGVNEIYVPTSNNIITRLEATAGEPLATPIFRTDGPGRMLALTTPNERSLILGGFDFTYQLRRLDRDGNTLWAVPRPADMSSMVDVNVGRLGPFGALGIVTGGGTTFPLPTYTYEALTGKKLWSKPTGTYWDGTFAVADMDGDGIDDIISNQNIEKGRVISGHDGETIVEPSDVPPYHNLLRVDYNGSPIIFDANGDGQPDILIAEDNAHMMMLRVSIPRRISTMLWAREQAVLDDERWSMPAIAPVAGGGAIIGVGTLRGVLLGVDSNGGGVRWETPLLEPNWKFGTNAVSSVVAVDIDGDGTLELIAGTESGRLFAVHASNGSILWSIDLGAELGDPIAADIDGDGRSEILVTSADGYLYVIAGGGSTRSRAVPH
ncbi:MAG: hypothetical protein JWO56_2708 [Acidobacteria bacterium]|nr:hypothetical protein [Acidobacteriota bacterium]